MATPLPDDVRQWIDRQAADERADLARTWDLAALAAAPVPADTEAAWARLDAILDAEPSDDAVQAGLRAWQRRPAPTLDVPAPDPVRRFLLARRPAVGGALALVAAAAVAAVVWLRPLTVTAGGDVRTVALPDGSAVALAPGSEVAYRRGLWGNTRRVALDGEAFFEVTTDGRPFVVETHNAAVEVLGTAFDVLAWPGGGETAVTLVEGSVRLRSEGGAVTLEPGEVSRVAGTAAPTPPVPVDAAAVTAWRDGAFSVVDAPLATVAAAVKGRFGRAVRLAPGVDAGRRVTMFLPAADSAEAVLRDLAAYLDLRLQATSDGFDLLRR